jgi:hypothetical protein
MKVSVWLKIVVIFMFLFMVGCEEETVGSGASTEVEILSPATGAVLSSVTNVTLSILNDDDLKNVHIMIDGVEAAELSKGTESWKFNPVFYNDGQSHTMIAIATDDNGDQSQSGVVSFSVNSATVLNPVYTTPSSGYIYAENEEVIIDWVPVVNAVEYTVQISDDKAFSTVLSEKTAITDQVSFGTLENKVYYFRIKAENCAGKIASWSAVKKVYVGVDEITWLNVYDFGAGPEWANAVAYLPDNTLITVGLCVDASFESSKISVVKTDMNGDVVWNKMIGPDNSVIFGNDVITDGDYIYITGGLSEDGYDGDLLLVKLDLEGNVVWQKTYGSYSSWGYKAKLGPDGSIYLRCEFNGILSVCKIGTDGSIIYAYSNYEAEWLCFDFDHNDKLVLLCGEYYDYPRRIKLDANGLELSDDVFGTTIVEYGVQIVTDESGVYLYEEESRIIKFGYDGALISQTDISDYEIISFVKSADNIFACGVDYFGLGIMLKINSSMTVEYTRSYDCGVLINLAILTDGSAVLCGVDTEYIEENSNMVILKTDKAGYCDTKTVLSKSKGRELDILRDRIKPRKKQ